MPASPRPSYPLDHWRRRLRNLGARLGAAARERQRLVFDLGPTYRPRVRSFWRRADRVDRLDALIVHLLGLVEEITAQRLAAGAARAELLADDPIEAAALTSPAA